MLRRFRLRNSKLSSATQQVGSIAAHANLTSLAGLTFADTSIVQLTGADTSSALTCSAANQLIGVNAANDALECKSTIQLQIGDGAAQFIGSTAGHLGLFWIDLAGSTTGKTTKIVSSQTDDRIITVPDATGTISLVKNDKLAVFSWDGGASALTAAAGTKRCAFVPSASTLTGLYASTEAESTSDITIALFKDAFAAGAHATTAIISGTNAVTIPAAGTVLNVNDTTLTNFTKTISAGDQICATITATDTTKWLQLTLYGTR